ncbi:hypothetical protein [Streptomyces sp. SM12]|uniref:hypothetical protein n=1 Tax=Streptomyces sp. SM12 TaxID=1071602 RepID=UPI000CD59735|nr:hypothetical protein [Streptomyces sp. SM12]
MAFRFVQLVVFLRFLAGQQAHIRVDPGPVRFPPSGEISSVADEFENGLDWEAAGGGGDLEDVLQGLGSGD